MQGHLQTEQDTQKLSTILGAFPNYEKRPLASSGLSVRPPICPHGTTRPPMDEFS